MLSRPLDSLLFLTLTVSAVGCSEASEVVAPDASCEAVLCNPSTVSGDAGRAQDGALDAEPASPDGASAPEPGPLGGEPGYGFEPGEGFDLPVAGEGFVFVPVPGTRCQDGSESGMAVARGSDELVIYLEGGGACFNDWSCLSSSTLFASRSFGASDLGRIPTQGIFSAASDNPVRDFTKIFVGYCSGDVFSGAADAGHNGEAQVGFQNLKLMLARIVPSFPAASRVLLTGSSAGGFGALYNWVQTQEAFGETPVDALSDSGPMFADEYLAPCLQHTWRDLWRWQDTLPLGARPTVTQAGGAFGSLFEYLVTRFPGRRFGLMSYTEDTVIRLFYGAGEQNCSTLIPSPTNYPGPRYTEGLVELRSRLGDSAGFSSFYVAGSDHTFLASDSTATASGKTVFAWLSDFLAGKAEHAGP